MSTTSAVTAPYLTQINDNNNVVEVTASTYTLSMVDLGRTLIFNSASAQTVTVPAGLTKYFAVTLMRIGAGAVTIAAGTGATLNTSGSAVLPRYTPVFFNGYTTSTYALGGADSPSVQTDSVTIATAAGNTDYGVIAPITGNLSAAIFSGVDALAANDTNYITWTITNRGLTGATSTAMLGSTTTNSTKATGGTAIAAETARTLTLTSTAADLAVVQGDRLRVRYAVTGTLANTVTGSVTSLIFTR